MKILMVCLGNICRSPLAEGILAHKTKTHNLSLQVDSAGTAAYHVGEKPDIRSIEIAAKYGIDISNQKARQFTKTDFQEFNSIYAMDVENYNNILKLASNEEDKKKVNLILNEMKPHSNSSVPDPYYGGNEGFESVYKMLDLACEKLLNKLQND